MGRGWLVVAPFLAAGIYGAGLGWGTDRDSVRVVAAASGILHGHYQRSRSFGFPLHEAASAALYALGGIWAVNLGALGAACIGIAAALRCASARALCVAAALCGTPLILANASTAIDFDWDFAAGMVLLWVARSLQQQPGGRALAAWCGAMLVLLLLRPDNALFAVAVMAALAWPRPRGWPWIVLFAAIAAVIAAAIYVWLNGTSIWATAVTTSRPVAARLARAAILLTAALGPGGLLCGVLLLRQPASDATMALLRRAALAAWLLYTPRFIALPDQADYLILPVALTVMLAAASLPSRAAWLCTALVVLPSFVTVSFLARDERSGALHTAVAPQWGALVQDWQSRRFALQLESPALAAYVTAQLHGPFRPDMLRSDVYMPGYISPENDLVIGRAQLYQVLQQTNAPARLATVPRHWYQNIWACDAPLGPSIGWRAWEVPTDTSLLARRAAGDPLACALVDKRQ